LMWRWACLVVAGERRFHSDADKCPDALQWWGSQGVSFAECCFLHPAPGCFDEAHAYAHCCLREVILGHRFEDTAVENVVQVGDHIRGLMQVGHVLLEQPTLGVRQQDIGPSFQLDANQGRIGSVNMEIAWAPLDPAWDTDTAFGLEPDSIGVFVMNQPVKEGALAETVAGERAKAHRIGQFVFAQCHFTCPEAYTAQLRTSMGCLDLVPVLKILQDAALLEQEELRAVNIGAAFALAGQGDPLDSLFAPSNELPQTVRALFVEPAAAAAEAIREAARALGDRGAGIQVLEKFATPSNAIAMLHSVDMWGDIDVLKVDVDGMECPLLFSILAGHVVRPKIVVVELLSWVPPPFEFCRYPHPAWPHPDWPKATGDASHMSAYSDQNFPTCSITYAVRHLLSAGYFLYKFNGDNAMFLREGAVAEAVEAAEEIQFPVDEIACYALASSYGVFPPEYTQEWFLPADPYETLGYIWANITAVNHHSGVGMVPFHLSVDPWGMIR